MKDEIKITVAIVEDDIIHYKLMKQLLSDEEYEVTWYQNGTDFLINIDNLPDIVTLDHMLPDMSGLDILKKIHEITSDYNILFFSGQEDVSVVVEAYKLGAKNYIVKNQNSFVEFKML